MAYFGYAPTTGTDEELLVLWREAFAKCSQRQSYKMGDKELTSADLPEIIQAIEWLDSRIGNATGPAVNHARMGRAS